MFSVYFTLSEVAQLLGLRYICCLAVPCKQCEGLPPSLFTQLPTMSGSLLGCICGSLGTVRVWHVEEVLWLF